MSVPPGVVDRRKTAIQAHGPNREWPVYDRPWSKVTGACLHQTACMLGERAERWDTAGAHLGITRAGQIIWLHDFTKVVAAANGWNAQCVSIEVDGLFAGIEGDPRTLWDDPSTAIREAEMHPTQPQIDALFVAVRWIAGDVLEHSGKPLHALVAHRQSSASRRDDPGSAIWKAAAPLMLELQLTDGGPGFKLDDGYAIPEAWDPTRRGIKY